MLHSSYIVLGKSVPNALIIKMVYIIFSTLDIAVYVCVMFMMFSFTLYRTKLTPGVSRDQVDQRPVELTTMDALSCEPVNIDYVESMHSMTLSYYI